MATDGWLKRAKIKTSDAWLNSDHCAGGATAAGTSTGTCVGASADTITPALHPVRKISSQEKLKRIVSAGGGWEGLKTFPHP